MTKVLLVDDEKDICILLSGILRKQGFDTSFALSLEEARKKLSANEYIAAFVDLNLPDGVGYELIPVIKNANQGTKVIIITAYDVELGKVTREGADYLIKKPFNSKVVQTALSDLMLN